MEWEGGGGDQGVASEGRRMSEAGVAFHASSTVGVAVVLPSTFHLTQLENLLTWRKSS